MARSKPLGRVRLLASHEPESAKPCPNPDDKSQGTLLEGRKASQKCRGSTSRIGPKP